MLTGLPHKTKTYLFSFIKISIVMGAFYVIYQKLAQNDILVFSNFIQNWSKNGLFSSFSVLFLLFLTIFNWFFEILKWQKLASYITPVSFKEATRQSLAAHTASLFTPNKIGEFGAKAFYYSKPLRKRILLLTLLGNTAQMSATFVFGAIGLSFFILTYGISFLNYKIATIGVIIVIIAAAIPFAINRFKFEYKGFSIQRIKAFIVAMPLKIHIKTMGYAIARYLLFSFQFYYLIYIFGTDLGYVEAMVFITSMYILSSIVPALNAFDVVIKGSIALYLFSFADVNELIILYVTSLMWLLNVVLPCIPGSFFVLKFDHYKIISPSHQSN